MANISDMIWIESLKAIRSKLPLWTALGSLFMPLGIAFLIFVSRNPEISRQLGLISAKADLMTYAATDWSAYLGLYGQMLAAAGLFLFSLVIAWVFGREFADGTLKDILAVPVPRSSILLAKFSVVAAWSAMLTIVIASAGLITGVITGLPGASTSVIAQGSSRVIVTAGMTVAVAMPFALFAGIGRGYLLPIGATVIAMMMAQVVALAGWGEYFPWAVPGLYAMGIEPLTPVSYFIVFLTGLAGMIATHLWFKFADQSR